MKIPLRIRLALAAAPLLLAACASTPRWDRNVGATVRATLAAQDANPAAAANPDPVAGVDGRAARAAQERYEHSLRQAPEQAGAPASMVGTK